MRPASITSGGTVSVRCKGTTDLSGSRPAVCPERLGWGPADAALRRRGTSRRSCEVPTGGPAGCRRVAASRQKSYGFLAFQFNTSASFQRNSGFWPLTSTE